MAVHFPEIGSRRKVRLLEKIERLEGESDESLKFRQEQYDLYDGVIVIARLVSPKEYRRTYVPLVALQRELEKSDGTVSDQMQDLFDQNNRDVCASMLDGVSGIVFGSIESDSMKRESLIEALEQFGLLNLVANACRRAQKITPEQKKSSGRSSTDGELDSQAPTTRR